MNINIALRYSTKLMLIQLLAVLYLMSQYSSGLAATAQVYRIIDTGLATSASAINDSRVVVGGREIYLGDRVYFRGSTKDIINDINNNGEIVGSFQVYNLQTQTNDTHAFIFSALPDDITPTDLGILFPIGTSSVAEAVNQQGDIVGSVTNENNDTQAFFITNTSNELILLGPFKNANKLLANAYDINDQAQIVGRYLGADGQYHGYLRDSISTMIYFDELLAVSSTAVAINNSGVVVGNYTRPDSSTASFIYDPQMNRLKEIPSIDGYTTTVADINDAGQVVGTLQSTLNSSTRGFIYDSTSANNTVVDINTITPLAAEWNIISAQAINNNGEIAVWGSASIGYSQRRLIVSPFRYVYANEPGKIISDIPKKGERLGENVAISGLYMVVNSKQNISFQIFSRIEGYWKSDQVIDLLEHGYSSDNSVTANYEIDVDIDGDLLVVGAPLDTTRDPLSNSETTNTGTVYIFRRATSAWHLEAKLTSAKPIKDGKFGRSVAINGNALVVGELQYNTNAQQFEGFVANYFETAGVWNTSSTIVSPVTNFYTDNSFGVALDMDDTRLVIGGSGNYYVFGKQGANWTLESKQGSFNYVFRKSSIKISGSTIAVLTTSTSGSDSGKNVVKIFKLDRKVWQPEHSVPIIAPTIDSISLGTDRLLVSHAGQLDVYVRNRFFFALEQTLTADSIQPNSGFGISSDIDGNQVIIGAHLYAPFSSMSQAGAAYVYTLCDTNCPNNTMADVSVVMTGPAAVTSLDEIQYAITVTNQSAANMATAIKLADTLPVGTNYLPTLSSPECIEHRPQQIMCSIMQIAAGATRQLLIAHTAPVNIGSMENTIEITSFGPDPDLTNNSDTVTVIINPAGNPSILVSEPVHQSVVTIFEGQSISLKFDIDGWAISTTGNNFQLFSGSIYQATYYNENDIDLGRLAAGTYNYTIKLADSQKQLTGVEKTVTFEVKILSPEISVIYPIADSTINRSSGESSFLEFVVNNWFRSDSYTTLLWSLGGVEQGELDFNTNRIDLTAFADGQYEIQLYLVDVAQIRTAIGSTIRFKLKTLQPEIIITQPQPITSNITYLLNPGDTLRASITIANWGGNNKHYHIKVNQTDFSNNGVDSFDIPLNLLRDDEKNTLTITLADADHSETIYTKTVTFSVVKNTSTAPPVSDTNPKPETVDNSTGGGTTSHWSLFFLFLVYLINQKARRRAFLI